MSHTSSSNTTLLQFAENLNVGTSTQLGNGLLKGRSVQMAQEDFILDVTGEAGASVDNAAGQTVKAELLASLEA